MMIRYTPQRGETLVWYYDQAGQMLGFTLNGVPYFYIRNLQGDVSAIIDANGQVVARYVYDAWGNILHAEGRLAHINPIRYRGYYFDWETGLFYLQSRYYDPVLRRFISPDVFLDTGVGILGTNVYIYCNNDPINLYDPTGYSPWQIINAGLRNLWDNTGLLAEAIIDWIDEVGFENTAMYHMLSPELQQGWDRGVQNVHNPNHRIYVEHFDAVETKVLLDVLRAAEIYGNLATTLSSMGAGLVFSIFRDVVDITGVRALREDILRADRGYGVVLATNMVTGNVTVATRWPGGKAPKARFY